MERCVLILEINIKLHCHLVDILTLAFVLLPYMLQIATGDEHQIVIADELTRVTDDSPTTLRILHEVQLHGLMVVDRIVELLLPAVGHIHEVVLL